MTIEQLLGMSADELDKLTKEQKFEYFSKYFPVTRPELQPPVEARNSHKKVETTGYGKALSKKAQAQAILDQIGFKLKL